MTELNLNSADLPLVGLEAIFPDLLAGASLPWMTLPSAGATVLAEAAG